MAKFKTPEKKSIPELEEEILKFWQKNKIFEKSVEQRPDDDLFVFYDGPPFISGLPHYGHLLGSIAKDIIPRYWTMKGKKVERVWGWDAHGLTVENKVQQKLGIESRRDIEKYGLEKFTEACYDYTSEISAEWEWYVDKIGRWVDMENAYKTIDQSYMESVIWVFKQLYEKGLIYEGIYTSLFCTTCGTPVSNFEIAMDNTYKEVEDPSITVKFSVVSDGEFSGANILAWTTTPWTIPSNRGLVVDADEKYSLVDVNGEKYIAASKRLEDVFSDIDYTVAKEVNGSELVGLEYTPPLDIFDYGAKEYKVYAYEGMVTMEEGTGVVHSAPGFGEIDTEMGRHYGLRIMLTIDDEGKFTAGERAENPYEGMFYAKANKYITNDLKEKGALFKNETNSHRVPYHDRCDTVLIQRAQNSWFVDIGKLKESMIENNQPINWVPEHLKHGRFEIGVKQAPDWCISRNRFWSTPMPVWQSEDGDRLVVGSIEELEDLSGQQVENLHRPYIDQIIIVKDGKTYKRIPEVLDSWFDAGSMPYAQIHYPFKHKQKFEKNFPGDYIVEYIAQTRAWFFFMHVLSTALFDTNSFKNVISTGVMAGSDGRKMSKTYGNYTDPREVLERIGGDALRLYLMNSPLMVGGNANFDDEELKTKSKNVLNPLWNSLKFFLIYAGENDWSPEQYIESGNILDKWIMVRLHQTIKVFSENIENYRTPPAIQALEDFVDDLSRWYVRRSRDRISNGDPEALSTLYFVLLYFAKTAAPAIPFMAEKIFMLLNTDEAESVHLTSYPEYDDEFISANIDLVDNMSSDREVVSEALQIRSSKGIPVRQPLSTLLSSEKVYFEEIVKDEINVDEIKSGLEDLKALLNDKFQANENETVALDIEITNELELRGEARNMIRKFQGLRKKTGLDVSDRIDAVYEQSELADMVVERFGDEIKSTVGTASLTPGDEYSITKKD